MSAASWMYSRIVAVSITVSPLHQWSQAIMPGFTQALSLISLGVLRLRMISLSISRPGCRPIISTRHGERCGVFPFDQSFTVGPRCKFCDERDRRNGCSGCVSLCNSCRVDAANPHAGPIEQIRFRDRDPSGRRFHEQRQTDYRSPT